MPSVFSRDKSVAQVYFEIAANDIPGIYLTWDRLTQDDLGFNISSLNQTTIQRKYSIQRSSTLQGPFVEIALIDVIDNEFIDDAGRPGYYYQIQLQEINIETATVSVLSTSSKMSSDELLVKTSLAYEIEKFLNVPVYDEEIRYVNSFRTEARLSYGNINYTPRPILRISVNSQNGYNESFQIIDDAQGIPYSMLVVDNPAIDYTVTTPNGIVAIESLHYDIKADGSIYFTGLLNGIKYPCSIPLYDIIYADYRVKMFSNTEMNNALSQALNFIGARPGAPHYASIQSTPAYYEPALINIGTYYLIRRLLMRLTQREIRLLFADLGDTPGGSSSTAGIDLLKELMNTYKENMDVMAKNVALAYYPKIATITGQTFQLPGSRSYMFRSMFFKAEGGYG